MSRVKTIVILKTCCDEDGKAKCDVGEGSAGQRHRGPSSHHAERPSTEVCIFFINLINTSASSLHYLQNDIDSIFKCFLF